MRRLVSGVAVAGLALALAPSFTTGGHDAPRLAQASTCPSARNAQMVEANVKTGMTAAQTRSDLAKVYADRPDFVALNEVHTRKDAELARSGYEFWRKPGRYTGANAVSWRTDRWEAISRGTIYVTAVRGKLPSQKAELGRRYANWVMLRSRDSCQTLSVVSYHVAPKGEPIGDLVVPSAYKLGDLAASLATDGPVLLAGDLNAHYKSKRFPRTVLASDELKSTWEATGKLLPTGDHHGATIDYIFMRPADQFQVKNQTTRELHSDHDAVVANLRISRTSAAPRPPRDYVRGHVENFPASKFSVGRRAVINRITRAVQLTPKGQTILMGTARLADPLLRKALVGAHKRGVKVRFVTWNPSSTWDERALMARFGKSTGGASYAIRRAHSKAGAMPSTAILFSKTGDMRYLAINADQPVDGRMSSNVTLGQFTREYDDFDRLRAAFRVQIR